MLAPEFREVYMCKLSTATTCYSAPQEVVSSNWNAYLATEKHVLGIQLNDTAAAENGEFGGDAQGDDNNTSKEDKVQGAEEKELADKDHNSDDDYNQEEEVLFDEDRVTFEEDSLPIPSGTSRKEFKRSIICVGYSHCQGWEAILLLDTSKAKESEEPSQRNQRHDDDDRTTASARMPRRTNSNASGASASSGDGTASTSATSVSSAQGVAASSTNQHEHRGSMGSTLNKLGHLEEEKGDEDEDHYYRPTARLILQHRRTKRQYTKPLHFRPLSPCITILSGHPNKNGASDADTEGNGPTEEIVHVWLGSADDSELRLYRNDESYILTEVPLQDTSEGRGQEFFSFTSPVMAIDYLKTSIKPRPINNAASGDGEEVQPTGKSQKKEVAGDEGVQEAESPQDSNQQGSRLVEASPHDTDVKEDGQLSGEAQSTDKQDIQHANDDSLDDKTTEKSEQGNEQTKDNDTDRPQDADMESAQQSSEVSRIDEAKNRVSGIEEPQDDIQTNNAQPEEPLNGDEDMTEQIAENSEGSHTEQIKDGSNVSDSLLPVGEDEKNESECTRKSLEDKEGIQDWKEEIQDCKERDTTEKERVTAEGDDKVERHAGGKDQTQESERHVNVGNTEGKLSAEENQTEEFLRPIECHHLAVACQDGTIRFLQLRWSPSLEIEFLGEYTVIVDGPIVGLHLNNNEKLGQIEAFVGSLCGYVARFFKRASLGEDWEGPFMVAEGFWNSRKTQEDSVLTVHSWGDKVAVGTYSGRCLLYGQASNNPSDDYGQPYWDCQLPDPIHGICHIPSASSILLLITTRRSIHVFQEIPKSYYPDMAKRKLQFLLSRTRHKVPENVPGAKSTPNISVREHIENEEEQEQSSPEVIPAEGAESIRETTLSSPQDDKMKEEKTV